MNNKNQNSNNEIVKFGLYVQKHRKAKGYTQQELAEILGITFKSVSCIERGINFPSPSNIFKLAEVLDMSLDEFVFSFKCFDTTICIDEINQILIKLPPKERKQLIGMIKQMSEYLLNNKE